MLVARCARCGSLRDGPNGDHQWWIVGKLGMLKCDVCKALNQRDNIYTRHELVDKFEAKMKEKASGKVLRDA